MKYALWFILLILCLDASLLYAAVDDPQPFPKELIDPSFLRQLTWRADKRIEQVVAGWPTYPDDQESQNWIVRRRTTIRILGSLFDAEYRTYKSKAEPAIFISALGSADVTDDCDALLTYIKQALGQPKKIVDLSSETETEISADWLFGDSRVQFKCLGLESEFIPFLISVHYSHRERLAALEAPIHLECSVRQQLVSSGNAEVSKKLPLLFIVDPNQKELRWSDDKSSFGTTETFTDKQIVAVRETEKDVDRIRIDRVSAKYRRTIRLKNGWGGLDQWGKCIRIAPGKKF